METKEATELELDPNVPIEDVVTALNDSTVGEEVTREVLDEYVLNNRASSCVFAVNVYKYL